MNEYLEFLKIAQQRYESQQNVLWKVETHYTWLVYIIAGALALVFFNLVGIGVDSREKIIRYGSIFGLLLAIIGYYVVRKEGEYLWETRQIYARTLLNLDKIMHLHPSENFEHMEWEDVRKQANKSFFWLIVSAISSIPWCIISIFTNRNVRISESAHFKFIYLTVRDAFQITLLLAALLFILGIVFAPTIVVEPPE